MKKKLLILIVCIICLYCVGCSASPSKLGKYYYGGAGSSNYIDAISMTKAELKAVYLRQVSTTINGTATNIVAYSDGRLKSLNLAFRLPGTSVIQYGAYGTGSRNLSMDVVGSESSENYNIKADGRLYVNRK